MTDDPEVWRRMMIAGSCPSLERLVTALGNSEDDVNQKSAEEHLGMCPNCRAEYDLWRDFQESRALPHEEQDVQWVVRKLEASPPYSVQQEPWWRSVRNSLMALRLGYLIPAAATALLVLVVVNRAPGELGPVSGIESDVVRSGNIVALEPLGTLDKAPERFRWQPVENAEYYVLSVFEVDRKELWTDRLTRTELELPAELRRVLEPGKTLLWRVTALDRSGSRLATSDLQQFRLGRMPQE